MRIQGITAYKVTWIIYSVIAVCGVRAETSTGASAPVYVAPFGTYLHPGGDTHGIDGWGAGLAVGKVINERFNVEMRGLGQNYHNDLPCCGGETDVYGATLDVQYYFDRGHFSPYLVGAAGGMINEIRTSFISVRESAFVFEAGAGATYQVIPNVLVRGDVRYRINTLPEAAANAGVLNDMVVNFGLVLGLEKF